MIAKFIGGKHINYSGIQSYSGRCAASVVTFNLKELNTYLSKKVLLRSPNKLIKGLESKKSATRLATAKRRIHQSHTFTNKKLTTSENDKNYGGSCQKPDLNEEDYHFAKTEHMKCIALSE